MKFWTFKTKHHGRNVYRWAFQNGSELLVSRYAYEKQFKAREAMEKAKNYWLKEQWRVKEGLKRIKKKGGTLMKTIAYGRIDTIVWTPTRRLVKKKTDYGHTEITTQKWV